MFNYSIQYKCYSNNCRIFYLGILLGIPLWAGDLYIIAVIPLYPRVTACRDRLQSPRFLICRRDTVLRLSACYHTNIVKLHHGASGRRPLQSQKPHIQGRGVPVWAPDCIPHIYVGASPRTRQAVSLQTNL